MTAFRKRRDSLAIIAEILEIAKGGGLKTHIMYKASLSFAQLNTYLSILVDRGFLEPLASSRITYRTSEKGLQLLSLHRDLMKLLKHGVNPTQINSLRLIKNGSRVTVSW